MAFELTFFAGLLPKFVTGLLLLKIKTNSIWTLNRQEGEKTLI